MFNLDNYEPVEDRLAKFWTDHKDDGRIETRLVEVARDPDGKPRQYIVEARAWVGDRLVATGFAEEIVGASPVNRTSALENAETSAIGRCLANANYAKKGSRPSLEEMAKVTRHKATAGDDDQWNSRGYQTGPATHKASAAQLELIARMARAQGFTTKEQILGYVNTCLMAEQLESVTDSNHLSKGHASAVIDRMKAAIPVEQLVAEQASG